MLSCGIPYFRKYFRKIFEALEGLSGVIYIANDVAIQGRNKNEHDLHINNFLLRYGKIKMELEIMLDSIVFWNMELQAHGWPLTFKSNIKNATSREY